MSSTIPHLDAETLEKLAISPAEAVDSIEEAIRNAAAGTVQTAPKATIQTPDGRYIMATLAASDDPPVLAVKSLVLNQENAAHGLAPINAVVTLLDSRTGLPLATLDGNWVTAVRTAALSACAARRIALPGATRAAFIGTGVQGRSHLAAFAALFGLTEVRAFGRGAENTRAFNTLAESLGLRATTATTAREAVEGAEIIVSSVPHSGDFAPRLDARLLAPGAFVTMVDLGRAWEPSSLAAFDCLVIDDLEQERVMPTPLAPTDWVSGDLAGLVQGRIAGRRTPQDRTAFLFRGHALGDLALSVAIWRRYAGR
ncbi:ornithine cyclodeaminase family protein [Defluviimonas sp. WL0075]|uniref:Ornithine cyclodeaminase family protein n=1 Tax=Albidovulum sediminicola TaxID=2984331 RepID=A0ABT2Z329_9RHOB|nr:ornithine cyclodeaminase family protein [Defluviimonas sp. WL0075]MCV2865490.1 ornithine cyclodeaminase family protein [Defluviimonas sp. WL0075]